jgi:hypothetical protein
MNVKMGRLTKCSLFFPAMVALLCLVAGPWAAVAVQCAPRDGLICYCCSGAAPDCPTFSCPNCHRNDNRVISADTSECVLCSVGLAVLFLTARMLPPPLSPPSSVCLDVPLRPPLITT